MIDRKPPHSLFANQPLRRPGAVAEPLRGVDQCDSNPPRRGAGGPRFACSPTLELLPYTASRETAEQPPPLSSAEADRAEAPTQAIMLEASPPRPCHSKSGKPIPEGMEEREDGKLIWSKGRQPFNKGKKGTRNRLATQFFDNLYAVWEEQGDAILRRAAFHEPMKFADMVAKLMPQKIEVRDTTLEDLESDKLQTLIERLEQHVAGGPGASAKVIEGRAEPAAEGGSAGLLSPLPKAT